MPYIGANRSKIRHLGSYTEMIKVLFICHGKPTTGYVEQCQSVLNCVKTRQTVPSVKAFTTF